mmetsp:Transcript_8755/g.33024  ORF Transcript_8755/g.33024 Transcript_8755/m.33024 type:complete len:200 (-) Transcript_8755:692-1291(-)
MFWLRRKSSNHSTDSMSKWLVGSSRSRRFGSPSKILPSPMRIFQPPLKLFTSAPPSALVKPTVLRILSTFASRASMLSWRARSLRSSRRSRTSCIFSGSSTTVSSSFSQASSSSWTRSSFSKTDMNSILRVLSSTRSSMNSCLRKATRRSLLLFVTSPVVGTMSPFRIFSCVVFPPPFGPTRPTRSPVFTSQVASLMTS